MENERNTTFSPLFNELKIYRKEIEKVKNMKLKSHNTNYAFYFLCLYSNAICENVDTKGVTKMIGKPNFYFLNEEIRNVFGVSTDKQGFDILDVLKNKYKVIDYERIKSEKLSISKSKIYVYINLKNENLPKGDYTAKNKNALNNKTAIKANDGFVLINKLDFFNKFYSNRECKPNVKDLYFLFRLNTVFNEEKLYDVIPENLQKIHIVLWRPTKLHSTEVNFSFYAKLNSIFNYYRIDERNQPRYLGKLEDENLISLIRLPNRGTVVIFSYLDELFNCEKVDKLALTENIKVFLKEFEIENNIPYSFSNKEFALLTNVNLKDSLSYSLEDYDEDGELLPHVRRK